MVAQLSATMTGCLVGGEFTASLTELLAEAQQDTGGCCSRVVWHKGTDSVSGEGLTHVETGATLDPGDGTPP